MVGLDAGGTVGVGGLELADGPLVLVVGSEGRGLSRLVAQRLRRAGPDPDGGGGRVAQRRAWRPG